MATDSAGSAKDRSTWHSGRVPSVEIVAETLIVVRRHGLAWKATVWSLKDELESEA